MATGAIQSRLPVFLGGSGATLIFTSSLVATLPAASQAVAVMMCVTVMFDEPSTIGHSRLYGGTLASPSDLPSMKNSTLPIATLSIASAWMRSLSLSPSLMAMKVSLV